MISISVKQAVSTLRSAHDNLNARQFASGVSRALNESILQGRTEARSAVKGIYNIPQRYLSGINVNKSTSVSLVAELYASAKPIPMDAFAPKFETGSIALSISKKGSLRQRQYKKTKKNPTVGVSIEVIKGNRQTIPFAFLIPGAKARVFARGEYKSGTGYGFVTRNKRVNKEGSDTPIKPLISVTVHAAVINNEALSKVQARVSTVFPVSVERNLNYLASKINT